MRYISDGERLDDIATAAAARLAALGIRELSPLYMGRACEAKGRYRVFAVVYRFANGSAT